jgi:hypothetical protein
MDHPVDSGESPGTAGFFIAPSRVDIPMRSVGKEWEVTVCFHLLQMLILPKTSQTAPPTRAGSRAVSCPTGWLGARAGRRGTR